MKLLSHCTRGATLLLGAFFALATRLALGATYYVSTTGTDAPAGGTSAAPWRTVAYAAAHVTGGLGHTIQVGAGTFTETSLIVLPTGVNLVGSGKTGTTITGSSAVYNTDTSTYHRDQMLIQLSSSTKNSTGQTIRDLTIDGATKHIWGGIHVYGRDNVIIKNVVIQNCFYAGVWALGIPGNPSTNFQLFDSTLKNNAFGNSGFDTGNVMFGDLTQSLFHDLKITEDPDSNGYGRYGMKALGDNYVSLTYTKFYNNTINVPARSTWINPGDGSNGPNIAVEIWHCSEDHNEFYNNTLNANLSLVGEGLSNGTPSMRVHHNDFNLQAGTYAVEASVDQLEIDHNHINGGGTPFGEYASGVNNVSIHHNVIRNLTGSYVQAGYFNKITNLRFYNNTIDNNVSARDGINIAAASSAGLYICNNVFYNSAGGSSNLLTHTNSGSAPSPVVKNNVLYNVGLGDAPSATGTISAAPQLKLTGTKPSPYYEASSGTSNVVNAGTTGTGALGFDTSPGYSGTPDIGAYENGGGLSIGAPAGPAASAPTPIGLTGWNRDVVQDKTTQFGNHNTFAYFAKGAIGGTAPTNGWGLFEAGIVGPYDGVTYVNGLPTPLTFSSALTNTVTGGYTQFQLKPYTGSNTLWISTGTAQTLTLSTPASYRNLAILAASGTSATTGGSVGAISGTLVLNFSDGTASPAISFNAADWTTTGTGLAVSLGLAEGDYLTQTLTNYGHLFETDLDLVSLGYTTKLLSSITFTRAPGSSTITGIFAISGLQNTGP